MSTVNITINGCHVQAKAGGTVLQAARQAGIEIPTLCHHPALPDVGACRICLVEVARQPALQPACTYPVVEGLEVQTDTPRVVKMRKFVLEMLFSERNHYCMYCEMSGDCELQALAYKHGLDHWTYPSPNQSFAVDGTREAFIMDHNRCILCRRCIRACGELAANHTLGLKQRGSKTMVCADLDVPFGESSCVECGTCLQVCPTGALVDRKSAYMGRNAQVERTSTACTGCAVGCQTQIVMRAGRPLRVEGDWAGLNGGVMCRKGRFEPLRDERPRIARPMIRKDGQFVEAGFDEAIEAIDSRMRGSGGKAVQAWTTAAMPNEALAAFASTFTMTGAAQGVLEPVPAAAEVLNADGAIADLDKADLVLVAGADPLNVAPVLGYRVKKAFYRKARVLVAADAPNPLDEYCSEKMALAKLDEAIAAAQGAAHPVVIAGAELGVEEAWRVAALKGKAKILVLMPAANSVDADALGLKRRLTGEGAAVAFVMAGDAELPLEQVARLRQADFLAVQAARQSELTAAADVVLPAPLWFEREGTFTNLEGRTVTVRRAAAPPEGVPSEIEVLKALEAKL